MTQFGSGKDEKLPAPKAGGLYKTHNNNEDGFVEASPSRVFRGGEGTLLPKLSHHQNSGSECVCWVGHSCLSRTISPQRRRTGKNVCPTKTWQRQSDSREKLASVEAS